MSRGGSGIGQTLSTQSLKHQFSGTLRGLAIAGNRGKGKAEEGLLEFQNISFSLLISWLRQRVHWNYFHFTDEERGLGRAGVVPSPCSCPEALQAGSSGKAAREIQPA